jgi:hypothetical protein
MQSHLSVLLLNLFCELLVLVIAGCPYEVICADVAQYGLASSL